MQETVVSHIVRLLLAGDSIRVEIVHRGDEKEADDDENKGESLV